MFRRISIGVSAGLVAGPVVGLLEAVYVLSSGRPSEYTALVYAALLYAMAGLAIGLACGICLVLLAALWKGLDEPRGYTLSFLGTFCLLGHAILRSAVQEALFQGEGISGQASAVILMVLAVVVGLGLWLGPIVLTRTPFKIVLRPRGTAALYGVLLLMSLVFGFSPVEGGAPAGTIRPHRIQDRSLFVRPDIMLVMVDSLRADQLGAHAAASAGRGPSNTPALDALAADGVLFEQVIAQAASSKSATASLLTSLLPSVHATAGHGALLPQDLITLPEVLQDMGTITGGLPGWRGITRAFNFQQGFDWYPFMAPSYQLLAGQSSSRLGLYKLLCDWRRTRGLGGGHAEHQYRPAEEVLGHARQFIEANQQRHWFLFLHLMEAHEPWFRGSDQGRVPDPRGGDEAAAQLARSAYADEVRLADEQLGRFLDWLREQGQYDETVIFLTANHGAELGERDAWGSGVSLREASLHVPLIVKLPRQLHAGSRVPWQVRQIDIPATIVSLAGAHAPDVWQGKDLFDAAWNSRVGRSGGGGGGGAINSEGHTLPHFYLAGITEDLSWQEHPASRVALAEEEHGGQRLIALRHAGWKLVQALRPGERGRTALYNLGQDPAEERDLAGQGLRAQGELSELLKGTLLQSVKQRPGNSAGAMDDATAERLRALGYLD